MNRLCPLSSKLRLLFSEKFFNSSKGFLRRSLNVHPSFEEIEGGDNLVALACPLPFLNQAANDVLASASTHCHAALSRIQHHVKYLLGIQIAAGIIALDQNSWFHMRPT